MLVSMVMSVYNTPSRFIAEAVRSFNTQTYDERELIVADFGSTNIDTVHQISRMKSPVGKVRVFDREYMPLGKARNVLNGLTNGELVGYLDSDDMIHPLYIETMVLNYQRAKKEDAATVGSGSWYMQIDDNGRPVKVWEEGGHPLLERKVLLENPYDENLYVCEDIHMIHGLLTNGYKIAIVKHPLYLYRKDQSGITKAVPEEKKIICTAYTCPNWGSCRMAKEWVNGGE